MWNSQQQTFPKSILITSNPEPKHTAHRIITFDKNLSWYWLMMSSSSEQQSERILFELCINSSKKKPPHCSQLSSRSSRNVSNFADAFRLLWILMPSASLCGSLILHSLWHVLHAPCCYFCDFEQIDPSMILSWWFFVAPQQSRIDKFKRQNYMSQWNFFAISLWPGKAGIQYSEAHEFCNNFSNRLVSFCYC